MATLLVGSVFYNTDFAGYLREDPNGHILFTYDSHYLQSEKPPISQTLPLQSEPHISVNGLHPFFDNLVAEGWLQKAQTRLLGKRTVSRFELLLAFGYDCIGAVYVTDTERTPLTQSLIDPDDIRQQSLIHTRASLSGVQPKMAVVADGKSFSPTQNDQISTHIAKFNSDNHPNIVENEYLTTHAMGALLPNDAVADVTIGTVNGIDESALLVKRFDRLIKQQTHRIHFEEFNQLLNRPSALKYDSAHGDMAKFIQDTPDCLTTQNYILYKRILAGILLGNTDMHLKNFALLYTPDGLRLTPSYDQVSAVLYNYKNIALDIAGAVSLPIGDLKPKHIMALGAEFDLPKDSIIMAVSELGNRLNTAQTVIEQAKFGHTTLKQKLTTHMEKRWNGTFALIGKN